MVNLIKQSTLKNYCGKFFAQITNEAEQQLLPVVVRIAMEPASKRKKKNSVETNSSRNAIHSRDTPLMLFMVEN